MAEQTGANLNLLKINFGDAQTKKDALGTIYNDVSEYTDVSTILDDTDQSSATAQWRDIATVITTSVAELDSFVMNSMFARGIQWASLSVNEVVYRNIKNLEDTTSTKSEIKKINEELEKNTETVFNYINQSNFYTEISRSARDALNLGTGCVKNVESVGNTKPIIYEYVTLNELFFADDAFGLPNYVYKKYNNKSKQEIIDMYSGYDAPNVAQIEEGLKINIVESVEPNYDETNDTTTYQYTVTDENFTYKIIDITLTYNPYIIFRWAQEGDLQWGVGIGIQGLDTFKRLKEWNELRRTQAQKIVKPPMRAMGDKDLIHKVSLDAGAVNYGGSGSGISDMGGTTDSFTFDPINLSTTLMPLDQDIEQAKIDIRDLYMSKPLGNPEEYRNRTATETTLRMQLMRIRWATSFELLQNELLDRILRNAFIIMIKKNLITFETENFDYTDTLFINELSKLKERERAGNIVEYVQMATIIAQQGEAVGLNVDVALEFIADQFNIPEDMRMSPEEVQALQAEQRAFRVQLAVAEQQRQQQRQLAEQAQGGGVVGSEAV